MTMSLFVLFLSCTVAVFYGGKVIVEIYTRLDNLEKKMKELENEK